jgi:hypothetical protein
MWFLKFENFVIISVFVVSFYVRIIKTDIKKPFCLECKVLVQYYSGSQIVVPLAGTRRGWRKIKA